MADNASFDCKFCRYLRTIEECSNGNYLDIIMQNSYKDEEDGRDNSRIHVRGWLLAGLKVGLEGTRGDGMGEGDRGGELVGEM